MNRSVKRCAGWLLLLIMGGLAAGCEEKKPLPLDVFYPFAKVASLEVKVEEADHKLFISKPVSVTIRAKDAAGAPVDVPDSLISLYVNDSILMARRFTPTDTGRFEVYARFGQVTSSRVQVISRDFIKSISVQLSRPVFYLGEDEAPVEISAILIDNDGKEVSLPDPTVLSAFVNGARLAGRSFIPDRTGDFKVSVRLPNRNAAEATLRSVEPRSVVGSIVVLASSSGGTHLGIANGKSEPFRLKAQVFDKNNVELPFSKDITFSVNGTRQSRPEFSTSIAGAYAITASGYGVTSAPLNVVMRKPLDFPVVRIPIILHFIDVPVPSQAELTRQLNFVNNAFRGGNPQPGTAQDPNSVDSYMEFEWAKYAPDGKPLPVPGVHEVVNSQQSYPETLITTASENNPCWVNFWHPNKYLNVWVLPVSGARWGGLGTLAVMSDSPQSEKPPFLYGTWINGAVNLSALTHEFGHNLGLFHTFNGDGINGQQNTPAQSCANDADACEDTPNYHRDDLVRDVNRISCEGFAFVSTNYMDYGPGLGNSFTYDQRTIVRRSMEKGLWLPSPRNINLREGTGRKLPVDIKPPLILK